MKQYRLSRFASLVHCDGHWYALNPSTRMEDEIELPPVVADGLVQLTRHTPGANSRSHWIKYLRARGVEGDQAEATVDSAIHISLLVPARTGLPWTRLADEAAGTTSEEVFALLSMTDALTFPDYGHPSIKAEDRQLMARYADAAAPPSPYFRLTDGPLITLPGIDPATAATTPLERLSRLLFWAFGRIRGIKLHGAYDLMLKPVPSMGARHPFEAYLFVDESAALEPGIYHYCVESHALEAILVGPPDSIGARGPCRRGTGTRLAVTLQPDRCQWRYRHSLAYRDVFLDLGHVVEMLHIVESLLDVKLTPVEWAQLAQWDGIAEVCVSAFQVANLWGRGAER